MKMTRLEFESLILHLGRLGALQTEKTHWFVFDSFTSYIIM